MARKQVFKLAKELGLSSRELLHELKEIGIEVKSNFSALEEEQIELIRTHLEGKAPSTGAPQAEAESTQAPQPAEVAPATATVKREPAESQTDGKPQGTTAVVEAEAPAEEKVKAPPKPVIPERPTGEPRPPVVAVLGHVDHGKTTLLDKIRQTHVAEQETGGITQSIGAYQVEYEGKKITFIDTPGHRAFTGMRARGAQVTDIVILVVAADDGVMEQTREAIAHAKAAGVPIIVAINKIDKPGADVTRVKQQLTEEGLTPEDWGGDTITVPVSAVTGEGIEDLLEMIQLVAELEELRADPKRPAQGTIIESHLDTARGPVATAIIKDGTLRERDVVIAGTAQGRIRALLDDQGRRIKEAPPGTPVQILGLSEVPPVGAPLEAAESPSKAKKVVEKRKEEERQAKITKSRLTWEDVLTRAAGQGTLKLILKADTVGSLEAVQNELRRLETEELSLEFIHAGVGHINESDVLLAASSEAEIGVVGFRVEVDPKAKELADREQVSVRTYEIIYELADDVRKALRSLLEPEFEEVPLGVVEVRQVFRIPRVGAVAGCYVRDGKVTRNAYARVVRNDKEVFTGKIHSLKRFDQDVREVTKEKECGIKIEGFDEIQVGDRLEIFTLREIERV
jgi:translation initiation factor IF-2